MYSRSMINWNNLRDVSYQVAAEKGWWESPRSLAIITLLMQTEVAEAVEDYRNHRGIQEVYFEVKKLDEPGKAMTYEEFEELSVFETMSYEEFKAFRGAGKVSYCKPCGIPVEIADVAIRICDFAGHHRIDLMEAYSIVGSLEACTFDDALARTNWAISMAYASTQANLTVGDLGQSFYLAMALRYLEEMCGREGIDLASAIQIKTDYNATRPLRHGGKKA